jgi:hypothetical protein
MASTDPEIAGLARALLERRREVSEGMADRIQKEVEFYRAGGVTRAELRSSCERNLEFILWPLATGERADSRPPRETGRRRAAQRAPLPELLAAYRVGFRYVWEALVAEAQPRGRALSDALVGAASALWAVQDEYSQAVSDSYRQAVAAEVRHDERERAALVESLLEGHLAHLTTVWEVAELLRLPASGTYVVIAAEVPTVAREALPAIESRLTRQGIQAAWHLRPDVQLGVAALTKVAQLDDLVAVLSRDAASRVGVSPVFSSLEQSASALRLARIAMVAAPAGAATVTVFDAAPLAVTAMTAAEILPRVIHSVLGPLLELPADDRAVLLETLEAWRDTGTAAGAAAKLYCHQNTIRYRLRRIEGLTGRSLSQPKAIAELCLALEGVRLLPPTG